MYFSTAVSSLCPAVQSIKAFTGPSVCVCVCTTFVCVREGAREIMWAKLNKSVLFCLFQFMIFFYYEFEFGYLDFCVSILSCFTCAPAGGSHILVVADADYSYTCSYENDFQNMFQFHGVFPTFLTASKSHSFINYICLPLTGTAVCNTYPWQKIVLATHGRWGCRFWVHVGARNMNQTCH